MLLLVVLFLILSGFGISTRENNNNLIKQIATASKDYLKSASFSSDINGNITLLPIQQQEKHENIIPYSDTLINEHNSILTGFPAPNSSCCTRASLALIARTSSSSYKLSKRHKQQYLTSLITLITSRLFTYYFLTTLFRQYRVLLSKFLPPADMNFYYALCIVHTFCRIETYEKRLYFQDVFWFPSENSIWKGILIALFNLRISNKTIVKKLSQAGVFLTPIVLLALAGIQISLDRSSGNNRRQQQHLFQQQFNEYFETFFQYSITIGGILFLTKSFTNMKGIPLVMKLIKPFLLGMVAVKVLLVMFMVLEPYLFGARDKKKLLQEDVIPIAAVTVDGIVASYVAMCFLI